MSEYKVTWTVDVEADSPRDAAEKALEMQRDKRSSAVIFEVSAWSDIDGFSTDTTIDLWEDTP